MLVVMESYWSDTNLLTHPHSHDDNVAGYTLFTHVGEFLPWGAILYRQQILEN